MAGGNTRLRFEITDDGTVRVVEGLTKETTKLGDEAEKSARKSTDAFGKIEKAAAATAAAVGAAGAAIVASVLDQSRQIDEVTKLSRSIGIAVGPLSELQVVADLSGVALGELGNSVVFFSRKMAEAESPTSKAGALFKALGVDVRDTRGNLRDTIEVIEDVADKFAMLDDGARKTALAQELFSRSGSRMISFLNQGSEAIREARDQARLLGITIDEETGAAAEQLNDDLTRLRLVMTGVQREVATALVPVFGDMAEKAFAWVVANDQLLEQNVETWVRRIIPAVETLGKLMEPVVFGLRMLGGDVKGPGAVMDEWRKEQEKIANGITGPEIPAWLRRSRESHQETLGMITEEQERINALLDQAFAKAGATGEKLKTGTFDPIMQGIEEYSRTLKLAQGGFYGADVAAQFDEIRTQAELVPGVINNWTDSIEQAQVAAVNLGDILSDSLVSAVDGLITRGDFNLGDVLESTGKAAMSRMVGAMIKEKLGFDATFRANFLEYLPGIASQGADLISRNFGSGLQAIAGQAGNVGQVINGSLTVNGLGAFPDTGYGMSVDALNYGGMTSAATGQAALVSGGATLAQGASGAAGAAMATPYGLIAGAAIGGSFAVGKGIEALAKNGAFGDRAAYNAGNIGLATTAAVLAPFTFGLAPLIVALTGKLPPNKDQLTRGALADVFYDAGIVPGMYLAKEPTNSYRTYVPGMQSIIGPAELMAMSDRERRDAGVVGLPKVQAFGGAFTAEEIAIGSALGLTNQQATQQVGQNLGRRAVGLGLSSEQYIRELRAVAGQMGSLDSFIATLTKDFQEAAINAKGNAFSQERYNTAVEGAIKLFVDDLPAGIDATAIALRSFEQVGTTSVIALDEFNKELERQRGIATSLQGGVAGAGQSAITALLTGGDPTAAWRSGLLSTVSSGIASNLVTSLFDNGGAFGAGLTSAILSGDPAQLEQALAGAGEAFGMLTSAAEGFVPIMQTLIDTIEEGAETLGPRSAYADQRTALASRIQQARIAGMSATQQQAYYQRQLGIGGESLGFLLEDGMISDAERPDFNYAIDQYSNSAFALLGLAGNYASGSRQQRTLQQQAYAALDVAQSALSIAAETATMNDVRVTTMHVASLQISPQAAANLHVG